MVLSQKTLTGGGNNDAGTPSFANAPISRFIAYKNCCPSPSICESNYLINFIQKIISEEDKEQQDPTLVPGTSNIIYSTNTPGFSGPIGNRLNIRPCNNDILFIAFYEKGSAPAPTAYNSNSVFILAKPEAPKFSKITVTGNKIDGTYSLDISTAGWPGLLPLPGGLIYRIYWWNSASSSMIPPPTGTLPTNFPTEGGIYNIEFS